MDSTPHPLSSTPQATQPYRFSTSPPIEIPTRRRIPLIDLTFDESSPGDPATQTFEESGEDISDMDSEDERECRKIEVMNQLMADLYTDSMQINVSNVIYHEYNPIDQAIRDRKFLIVDDQRSGHEHQWFLLCFEKKFTREMLFIWVPGFYLHKHSLAVLLQESGRISEERRPWVQRKKLEWSMQFEMDDTVSPLLLPDFPDYPLRDGYKDEFDIDDSFEFSESAEFKNYAYLIDEIKREGNMPGLDAVEECIQNDTFDVEDIMRASDAYPYYVLVFHSVLRPTFTVKVPIFKLTMRTFIHLMCNIDSTTEPNASSFIVID